MPDTINKSHFDEMYNQRPPWDIEGPQAPFGAIADQVRGRLLDSGCGSGETALFFAARGVDVTGVDFLEKAVEQARGKAAQRGVQARFLAKDALKLGEWDERFDAVVDSGLFHVFSDADRATYVKGLATVLKPGGMLYLLCFSDRTPGTQGPRRVTRGELEAAFASGWAITSLAPALFEVLPSFRQEMFAGADPEAWFLVARRT